MSQFDRMYVSCPFCKEQDFDLIGLKHHLQTYCDAFDNTETIEEERQRRDKEIRQAEGKR